MDKTFKKEMIHTPNLSNKPLPHTRRKYTTNSSITTAWNKEIKEPFLLKRCVLK